MEIMRKHYDAVGIDHTFQREITEFMHKLIAEVGEFTLAEIGYLHMSTLNFNLQTQCIELKIYFDLRLAGRRDRNVVVSGQNIVPISALNIFQGCFFVGNVADIVTYERVLAPKVEIVDDELNRPALRFKDKGHKVENLDVLVLNCSYPLVMAAINDISLRDPGYRPTAHIIAKASDDAMKSIVTNVKQTVVPLSVDLEYTKDFGGYDYNDAIPYLQKLSGESAQAARNQEKIVEAVERRAKKNKKKQKAADKWFNKYT